MKPTLYAEDLDIATGLCEPRLARVLPRRCPTHHQPITDEGKWDDCTCVGAGFLYPDPPDWWHAAPGHNKTIRDLSAERAWPEFCDTLYRVLGIVDTE